MSIELNHTIVPTHDNGASARFYRDLFGFEYSGPLGRGAYSRDPNRHLLELLTQDYTAERFQNP